jgi:glucose/arabinose dehydrogenase
MRRVSAVLSSALLAVPIMAASACAQRAACDEAGLKLPAGFCATIFADSLPGVRSIAVAPNGDVFASLSTRGGGLVALRDAGHTGKATQREHLATGFNSAQVAIHDGHLYAEAMPVVQRGAGGAGPRVTAILRYPMKSGELALGAADTVVKGIPNNPGHFTRNFAITRDGVLYLNIGSATNSCQEKDRAPRSPGVNPCTELETRAGVWKFDAKKNDQTPSASNHFARGIRNAVGIAIAPDGKLWTTQHGRDDLQGWRSELGLDSAAAVSFGAENPAEELMQVNQGDDFGWPYCYYSFEAKHLVLAPEFGGDGKKMAQCAQKNEPVALFPGHWAPNALMFYTGTEFPARYRNGAFVAFHGSWNRAPEPQAGFNVVFQPVDKAGKASGKYEVFADNFSPNIGSGRATAASGAHRPTGLAMGTDGSLYVSDDAGGRIYRITYSGGK